MSTICKIKGCEEVADTDIPTCKSHWHMVSRDIKRDFWQHHQKTEELPVQAYLDAVDAAIECIEEAELEKGKQYSDMDSDKK